MLEKRRTNAIGLKERLLTIPDEIRNPGSCSVPLALAQNAGRIAGSRVLAAGFGAGSSASAGIVRMSGGFEGRVL